MRKKRKKPRSEAPKHWKTTWAKHRTWILRGAVSLFAIAVVAIAAVLGITRLEAHVHQRVTERGASSITFVDLTEPLSKLAYVDLYNSVADLLERDWTEEDLCREMASRLSEIGWVHHLNHVRRTSHARFEVSAVYRFPAALVAHRNAYYLVDRDAVRLPGNYRFDPGWMLIQGVSDAAPAAGKPWESEELRAGLKLAQAISADPYRAQITAVSVENFKGRKDARRSHLELLTDRPGRIRWGSALGMELVENTLEQKRAILLGNFKQTGRADAGHSVIDISTFPDRYTVPGQG